MIIAAASLLLSPLPGPGWGTVFLGLGIIAGEYKPAAGLMDRSEVSLLRFGGALRKLWRGSGAIGRAVMLIAGAALTAIVVVTAVNFVHLLL